MISDVIKATREYLGKLNIGFNEFTFSALLAGNIPGINRPHVNMVIRNGGFSPVTMSSYEVQPIMTFYITVQNLNSQEDAQLAAVEFITLLVKNLLLQNFGIELQHDFTPPSSKGNYFLVCDNLPRDVSAYP